MTTTRELIDALVTEERPMLLTGALGIALAGMLGMLILVNGPVIEPEARLFKAASFDFALGFYVLTLGFLAPLAGFTPKGRSIWRWSAVSVVLVSYGIETIQMLRGLDPRFTRAGAASDQLLGGVFFLIAQGTVVVFLIFAWKLFRSASDAESGLLVLSVRYGSLATIIGFSMGYTMSAGGGPQYGAAGNMLPLHAAGFHGLQAVPLVALLLADSGLTAAAKRVQVHIAGVAWLALCAGIALQTAAGGAVLELSAGTVLAAGALAIWVAVAGRSAVAGLPALRHTA